MIECIVLSWVLLFLYYFFFLLNLIFSDEYANLMPLRTKKEFWLSMMPFGYIFILSRKLYNGLEPVKKKRKDD